jgi:hypothetical protein
VPFLFFSARKCDTTIFFLIVNGIGEVSIFILVSGNELGNFFGLLNLIFPSLGFSLSIIWGRDLFFYRPGAF